MAMQRVITAQRFRFADNGSEVGVIPSVSEPFCENCNRIRLTADGKFRTCLFSITETDCSRHYVKVQTMKRLKN